MASPDDNLKKKSRREFIKLASAIVLTGAVGVGVGAAGSLLSENAGKSGAAAGAQTLTATETTTETDAQTNAQTALETVTSTLTATETTTQTVTVTQTETQALSYTTIATQTVTSTEMASAATTLYAPFSIFWITDTQFLSEENPALYSKLTNWIANNWDSYNGKMVIHTGDIVQTGNVQSEWENADAAMSVFSQNGIPYSWCAGNHDDLVINDSTSGWNGNVWTSSFDPSVVSGQLNQLENVSWVDSYHDGMNTAVSFSANGLNFLVVNLEWNAQPGALAWAYGHINDPKFAQYHIILAPHAYINFGGSPVLSSNYVDLTNFVTGLTEMMDKNSNVFLSLNGHYSTECGYNTPAPIGHRNELMFDRQDCEDLPGDETGRGVDTVTTTTPDSSKVGGATVTILTFDTNNNQVNVSTYDVNTGGWRGDPYEQYSFTLFPTPASGSSTG